MCSRGFSHCVRSLTPLRHGPYDAGMVLPMSMSGADQAPVDEPEPMSLGGPEQAPVTQVTQVTQVDAGDADDAGDAEDSDAPVARRTKRTGKSFQAANSETSGRERDNR